MMRPALRGVVTAIVVGIVAGGSLGLYMGLHSRPVGMGSGVGSSPRLLAIGSPSGGGGWITLYRGSEAKPFARTQIPWKAYDDEAGSAQPVTLRLGGGAEEQIAVALGPTGSAPGG